MSGQDDKRIGGPGREPEGDRQSSGLPAAGKVESGAHEPLGRTGLRHWRESTITEPGLHNRGNVFFAAVEMTRMPMILTDPRQADNPIVFANKAFLDLTGYEEGEVLGRNCRFLQGVHTDRETVRALRECIAAREAISIEILNYRRDGSAFWNAVFIGPVYDKEGELLYFFASQLDVTRRRESEQSFRQAQKMEAIGQLTAGLAHDFNNLLHVVTGSLERLAPRVKDDGERYIKAAMTAADRGSKLTRQLLAFARRSRLEPRPIDLTALVGSITELLDSTVGSRAELQLNLRRKLPTADVDPILLEMALLNVVINARDAMPKGGKLTIETGNAYLDENYAEGKSDVKPGQYVLVSVSDTGCGMSKDVIQRAFEPFFTTKPAGQGTGLGLAMAHGFVQQSGGRLEIDSEPGQGTTIRMIFPVSRRTASPEVESDLHVETMPVADKRRILVVDDSVEIREMAEEALQEVGYQVVSVASGEAALEAFESAGAAGGFDLVFSDVVMPGGMNGLVLAEEIRRRAPHVPVLLTTGYNDELALEGPRAEAMDVIGKPYRRSELIERVQSALRRGARTGPGRKSSDFGAAEA